MIRRVALGSAAAVALIAGALFVTVVKYRAAVAHQVSAAAAIEDAALTNDAEHYLAEERDALTDAVLGVGAKTRDDIEEAEHGFAAALSKVGIGELRERRLVRRGLAANDELMDTFRAVVATGRGAKWLRRVDETLDVAEEGVLRSLRALREMNEAQQREVDAAAGASSRSALLFAIIAGAAAIAGGISFGWYAVRLIRDIASRNERLRRLDQLKDDFVATVSHELRTPLTSIRGYLDLVLEGDAGALTDEQHHFLTIVHRNADRVLHVSSDLLFVAQIEAGTLSLARETTGIDELVMQAVEVAQPTAAAKSIQLQFELGASATVDADRARLGQVLDNLISNAIKFTPPGGHVTVSTSVTGDTVAVEVADDGMGMTEEDLGQLFQRFFRTSAAAEQAIQGTGLGLAISQAIVKAHDGEITATSLVGEGTTFRVELPLVRELVAA